MNPHANPPHIAEPSRAAPDETPLAQYRQHPAGRSWFRRGPWETIATVVILLGVVMLMQPFALPLYTYSFVTILTGTILFVIVSHFRD
jgi:hypothetical protein